MAHKISLTRRQRTCTLIGVPVVLAFILALIMLVTGFLGDIGTALSSRIQGVGQGSVGEYFGPESLEEKIVGSDVVALARLISVASGVDIRDSSGTGADTKYVGALIHKFEVIEYLKGSGASELTAVVYDAGNEYQTRLGANLFSQDLSDKRDTRWDDREAIIFLANNHPSLPSSQQGNRYWFGIIYGGEDYYTIASRHSRDWLPGAVSGRVSGASSNDEQQFLMSVRSEMPKSGDSIVDVSVSGQSNYRSTITLSELKSQIAKLDREVNAGDGSEEYQSCIYEKYTWERKLKWYEKFAPPEFLHAHYERSIISGLPAGSSIYTDAGAGSRKDRKDNFWNFWLEGKDADLFTYQHPGVVYLQRPLPAGEFRVYFNIQPYKYIICNAYPDAERTARELIIQVTASEGAAHEAFFDPSADGIGDVFPAEFQVGGATTAITGLGWEDGLVTVSLSPYTSLAGYALDFIALDGSVVLSLGFPPSLSASDGSKGYMVWDVAERPWQDGDKLTLRVREAEPTPTATPAPVPTATPALASATAIPIPTATPTATPEPTAGPEPTPTPIPAPTPTPTPEATVAATPEPAPTPEPLRVSINVGDTQLRVGERVTLRAVVSGALSGEVSYQWQVQDDGGQWLSGRRTKSETSFGLPRPAVRTVRVVVTQDGHSAASAPVTLTWTDG